MSLEGEKGKEQEIDEPLIEIKEGQAVINHELALKIYHKELDELIEAKESTDADAIDQRLKVTLLQYLEKTNLDFFLSLDQNKFDELINQIKTSTLPDSLLEEEHAYYAGIKKQLSSLLYLNRIHKMVGNALEEISKAALEQRSSSHLYDDYNQIMKQDLYLLEKYFIDHPESANSIFENIVKLQEEGLEFSNEADINFQVLPDILELQTILKKNVDELDEYFYDNPDKEREFFEKYENIKKIVPDYDFSSEISKIFQKRLDAFNQRTLDRLIDEIDAHSAKKIFNEIMDFPDSVLNNYFKRNPGKESEFFEKFDQFKNIEIFDLEEKKKKFQTRLNEWELNGILADVNQYIDDVASNKFEMKIVLEKLMSKDESVLDRYFRNDKKQTDFFRNYRLMKQKLPDFHLDDSEKEKRLEERYEKFEENELKKIDEAVSAINNYLRIVADAAKMGEFQNITKQKINDLMRNHDDIILAKYFSNHLRQGEEFFRRFDVFSERVSIFEDPKNEERFTAINKSFNIQLQNKLNNVEKLLKQINDHRKFDMSMEALSFGDTDYRDKIEYKEFTKELGNKFAQLMSRNPELLDIYFRNNPQREKELVQNYNYFKSRMIPGFDFGKKAKQFEDVAKKNEKKNPASAEKLRKIADKYMQANTNVKLMLAKYHTLHLLDRKMNSFFQNTDNVNLRKKVQDEIRDKDTIEKLNGYLEEIKKTYKPRDGIYKVGRMFKTLIMRKLFRQKEYEPKTVTGTAKEIEKIQTRMGMKKN